MTDFQTDRLVRDIDAAALLGCSRTIFWRRVNNGTVPQPVRIGGMTRLPASEIIDVINKAKARLAA